MKPTAANATAAAADAIPHHAAGATAGGRVSRAKGLVVMAVFLAVVVGCVWHPPAWRWFGVAPFEREMFVDAYPYLVGAEAAATGADPYARDPQDVFGHHHVNGIAWLWLGKLGVRAHHGAVAGWLSIAVFALALAMLLRPRTWGGAGVCLAALLSPGVLLGVERANNDLLLFALITAAVGLAARGKFSAQVGALALVTFAAAAKYFPAAAFILLGAAGNRRLAWRLGALAAACLLLLVLAGLNDPILRGGRWPDPITPAMFGFSAVLRWMGWSHAAAVAFCGLCAALAFAGALFWRRGKEPWWPAGARVRWPILAAAAGFAVLIGAYVTAGNYPYRLLWWLLVLPLALEANETLTSTGRRAVRAGVALGLLNLLWYELARGNPDAPSIELAAGFQLWSALNVGFGIMFLAEFVRTRVAAWSENGGEAAGAPRPAKG